MRKMADTLDRVTSSIADIYAKHTKIDKKDILAMMSAETWFTAEEAVAYGFADSIKDQKAVKNSFDLSRFKNAPPYDPVDLELKRLQLEINKRK